MAEFRNRLVKDLSGGERRRVDLAAGLIDRPQLLVLDEPTTGLDPRSRQVVWSTVRELVAEGVTLLLTTQYLEEADALADRVVLIDHGREIAAGTPAQLKAQVGEQRVDVIAADSAGLDRLLGVLDGRFTTSVAREQRTISIPAPGQADDLARVAEAVRTAGSPSMRSRFAARLSTTHFSPSRGARRSHARRMARRHASGQAPRAR